MSFWQGLSNYSSGVRERLSGQTSPTSGMYGSAGMGMPQWRGGGMMQEGGGGYGGSLMDMYNRLKGGMGTPTTKYMRQGSTSMPSYGANAPMAIGDEMRMTMASPYSSSSPSRYMPY